MERWVAIVLASLAGLVVRAGVGGTLYFVERGPEGPQGEQGERGSRGPAGPALDPSDLQGQIDELMTWWTSLLWGRTTSRSR